MRICVLDEVTVVEDLLCVTLQLRHHQPTTYRTPLMCLEALKLSEQCCSKKIELLIIGDHPKTSFSWRQVVEQARIIKPELPVLLISNNAYYETLTIEQQLMRLKVLDEPFHLKDFYSIIDQFNRQNTTF
jgi:DNA-binding NtrC family response regulator